MTCIHDQSPATGSSIALHYVLDEATGLAFATDVDEVERMIGAQPFSMILRGPSLQV